MCVFVHMCTVGTCFQECSSLTAIYCTGDLVRLILVSTSTSSTDSFDDRIAAGWRIEKKVIRILYSGISASAATFSMVFFTFQMPKYVDVDAEVVY